MQVIDYRSCSEWDVAHTYKLFCKYKELSENVKCRNKSQSRDVILSLQRPTDRRSLL